MTGSESNHRRPPGRLLAGRAPARPKGPSITRPHGTEATTEGLSFTKVLHDCLASGVILVDSKKKVASLNDQAKKILGLSPDQAPLPQLAALPAALRTMARAALASGKSPAGRQVKIRAGKRGAVTVHASAVPLHVGRKNSGVVLVLHDLTPARQIEQHIQQLDRLASIGTLAAGMAHEIKNALVAGKTFVDLLLEKHQDAELVEVVRREMGRIDAIVSRMRSFAGSNRPSFSEVRLHETLEHSLRLVQPQLDAKLVALDRSFQASPDVLHGDDYQLQQAFVNLFLNALEAMGPNGTLSVATDVLPPGAMHGKLPTATGLAHLQLTIKDNGIGISRENMARLFEPFFTTKPNGTGLGLLITQRIIQEHRGAITVQSEPDKGTTFRILLPASA
jgi:nitrogen-specific signal transduction histidine kinase